MSRNENPRRTDKPVSLATPPARRGWSVIIGVILSCGLGALMTGCATNAQTNSLIGAGLGAAIGNWIGDDTQGTLIGAGVGAAAGYAIGNEADKADARARDRYDDRDRYEDRDRHRNRDRDRHHHDDE